MNQGYCLSFLSVSEIREMETSRKVKSEFLHFEQNKKICVIQVTLLTLIFLPPILYFFPHFGENVHLKRKWKARNAF